MTEDNDLWKITSRYVVRTLSLLLGMIEDSMTHENEKHLMITWDLLNQAEGFIRDVILQEVSRIPKSNDNINN